MGRTGQSLNECEESDIDDTRVPYFAIATCMAKTELVNCKTEFTQNDASGNWHVKSQLTVTTCVLNAQVPYNRKMEYSVTYTHDS